MTELHVDTKAVVETRLVHNVHREATRLLADAAARTVSAVAVAELRGFVVDVLHHHHESEDKHLWPLLVTVAPGRAGELVELSREHAVLESALDGLAEVVIGDRANRPRLAERAAGVRDLVHQHLEHEEPILFPVLRGEVPEDAWDRFSAQTIASFPPAATDLLVALLDRVGEPGEIDVILGSLPDEVRELIPGQRERGGSTLAELEETS